MGNVGLELAKNIMPPDVPSILWWRLVVSGSILALAAVLLVHLMHACGWGPFAGEGFAMAADVNGVRAQLLSQEIDAIDYSICIQDELDPQLITYHTAKLREYKDVTGNDYRHKPCTLLVKLVRAR